MATASCLCAARTCRRRHRLHVQQRARQARRCACVCFSHAAACAADVDSQTGLGGAATRRRKGSAELAACCGLQAVRFFSFKLHFGVFLARHTAVCVTTPHRSRWSHNDANVIANVRVFLAERLADDDDPDIHRLYARLQRDLSLLIQVRVVTGVNINQLVVVGCSYLVIAPAQRSH